MCGLKFKLIKKRFVYNKSFKVLYLRYQIHNDARKSKAFLYSTFSDSIIRDL